MTLFLPLPGALFRNSTIECWLQTDDMGEVFARGFCHENGGQARRRATLSARFNPV
jgi:hypothetical protein